MDDVSNLREEGKFKESITLAQVMISDLYGSLALAYRHLHNLQEAKKAAEESVKIAKENNLKGDLARPLFNLAKVQEELGEISKAVVTYKESIGIFQQDNPKLHNRSGVLADMKIHLAVCEYKNGDRTALDRILQAINELDNSDEKTVSKYNFDVWMSGAYMNLAEILKDKKYLMKAKEIIDANSELKLRKEQWEKLNKSFL